MRNILLHLMVVLSVFSVQGCWAGETKNEISQDGKSMESDSIDASKTDKDENDNIDQVESYIIDESITTNARWCGNDVVVYSKPSGEINEIGHDVYDQIWWKNIKTKQGGKIKENASLYDCSPDGQWVIYGEKNFTLSESEKYTLSRHDVDKKYDIKLKNIQTGEEENLPRGGINERAAFRKWSADGKRVFFRGFENKSSSVFQSEILKGLTIYYLPHEYTYFSWLPDTSLVIAGVGDGGRAIGIFDTQSGGGGGYKEFEFNGVSSSLLHLTDSQKITSNGNLYFLRSRGTKEKAGNVIKCEANKSLLNCKKLFPESYFWNSRFSVLPSDGALHFYWSSSRERDEKVPTRYSIESGNAVEIKQSKIGVSGEALIEGQFSPDGMWVLFDRPHLHVLSMANYYKIYGSE